jgi:hypothetical protein
MGFPLLNKYARTSRSVDTRSKSHRNTVPRLHWSWHGTAAAQRVNGEMRIMERRSTYITKDLIQDNTSIWEMSTVF